ncbi:MAG: Ig-like domain-containing protein [Bacteroidales bacterium]|nr:Ig-like domain-containing protein [Bacteroidales bacterium]
MKNSLKYLLSAILVLAVVACQDKEEPDTQPVAPTLSSVSVADGATDVSVSLGEIYFTYDIPIAVGDASLISMSGTTVTATAQNLRLVVSFGTLEYGTQYTLSLRSGAVVSSSSKTAATATSVTFTTVEKGNSGSDEPDEDEPTYTPGTPGDYSASLVSANPLPAATALYEYMLSIYGDYTLSGAMANVNWNTEEAEWVHTWTGKYPAIAFFDYIHLPYSPANWIDYSDITPVKDWWEAGGLAGASWHWLVPSYEGCSIDEYTYDTTGKFKASNVLVDGTWENTVAKADLDKIADYILLLQNAGIPLIWRPLHEAAGNVYNTTFSGGTAWFWWGADGAATYRALWKFMFDYFAEKGVRNLIWVWTTQTTTEADADYAYYPGDDYVDIVGRDVYNESGASNLASQFNNVAAMTTHKMVTLSELGNVANISQQWNSGAKWLYFMPWYDNANDGTRNFAHEHADINWWTSSFGSSAVLDRESLPSSLFSN